MRHKKGTESQKKVKVKVKFRFLLNINNITDGDRIAV